MQPKWGIKKIAKALGLKAKTKERYDCKETLQHVMRALDNELSEEEEKDFLAHVNCCSKCLEKYHIEQSFKSFLSEKIAHHSLAPNIADQIRTRIRETMEH